MGMKRKLPLLALPLLAGCLTSAPPSVATWTIDYVPAPTASAPAVPAEGAPRGSVRVSQVVVRAPYDAKALVVLRPDGSLSFDRLMQVEWTWEAVRRLGAEAMASFFLGGFLLAIVFTPPTYFIVKRVVTTYRRTREQKRHGTAR